MRPRIPKGEIVSPSFLPLTAIGIVILCRSKISSPEGFVFLYTSNDKSWMSKISDTNFPKGYIGVVPGIWIGISDDNGMQSWGRISF